MLSYMGGGYRQTSFFCAALAEVSIEGLYIISLKFTLLRMEFVFLLYVLYI